MPITTSRRTDETWEGLPELISTPKDQNVWLGTACVASYLLLWLLSLMAPLTLLLLMWCGWYTWAVSLVIIILMCYLVPWTVHTKLRTIMADGSMKYFRNCTVTYENKKELKNIQQNDQQKKDQKTDQKDQKEQDTGRAAAAGTIGYEKMLLAVHPHGIFCMGWAILFSSIELRHFDFCFSRKFFNILFIFLCCSLP